MKIKITETRTFRCGVTRLHRFRNKRIRESLGVTDITNKIRKNKVRWFGYFRRKTMTR